MPGSSFQTLKVPPSVMKNLMDNILMGKKYSSTLYLRSLGPKELHLEPTLSNKMGLHIA